MPGIDPHKYRVQDELNRVLAPTEYFVLRRGDALAVATLRSYAANALQMLDLNRMGLLALTEDQREHLVFLADHVTQRAYTWEQDTNKLPD